MHASLDAGAALRQLHDSSERPGTLRVLVGNIQSWLDGLPADQAETVVTTMPLLLIPILCCCLARCFRRCCCYGAYLRRDGGLLV